MIPAQSISQSEALVPWLIALATAALVCGGAAWWSVFRLQSRWKQLLKAESGSLEEVLQRHLDHHQETLRRLNESESRLARLEEQMLTSKRYLGAVRYDAFPDVGGAQSFALAIYDDRGDGAVITSQVGRADCRVYCKALTRGRPERPLSEEEQRAFDAAYQGGGRPVISP